jgi:hypothetical protein
MTGIPRVTLCEPARQRQPGVAILVLVVVFLAALFVTVLATSMHSSSVTRSYARAALSRLCLEAAVSAFAEASSVLGRSVEGSGSTTRTRINWKRALLPPYDRPAPRGTIVPLQTRKVYAESHGLEVSDVDVSVVHWKDLTSTDELVRGHGVLELVVTVRGARSWLQSSRTVRRRVQFYCRHKPAIDWPTTTEVGHGPRIPTVIENSDVVILTSPIATVLDS